MYDEKQDAIQIVDRYPHFDERNTHKKINYDTEAHAISALVKPFGRNISRIAIIAQGDEGRLLAYRREGYDTRPMNGNRAKDLRQFIRKMISQIKKNPPKHVILVSESPEFIHLCDEVAPVTDLAVWANSHTAAPELTELSYVRPLDELLPDLKSPRIDVRLDLENIFIGLVQRGWRPNLHELIKAIHQAMDDLGEIATITGYADFDELNRRHGGPNVNWQRALTEAGGESRYVINQHGKNSADMRMVEDIRTLVEHNTGAGGVIDIIALVTMDRDFRHIVDTVRGRGKRIIVLGLKDGVSGELERASEVRYLDKFLNFARPSRSSEGDSRPPSSEEASFMLQITAWMHCNRWRFVYLNRLEQEFGNTPARAECLKKLVADRWLVPSPNSSINAQGQARTLEPNNDHAAARAAHYLSRWIPARVGYCLTSRGMPYVDSNFLANGMARDTVLTRLNVGQTYADAEFWLCAAAKAKLVVAREQSHPQTPAKRITTWWLQEETATPQVTEMVQAEETPPPPASSYLRHLLTQKLNDNELTQLIFDYFNPVYREIDGSPKFTRIQVLLDYVERHNLHNNLLSAIREINRAMVEEPSEQLLAA